MFFQATGIVVSLEWAQEAKTETGNETGKHRGILEGPGHQKGGGGACA